MIRRIPIPAEYIKEGDKIFFGHGSVDPNGNLHVKDDIEAICVEASRDRQDFEVYLRFDPGCWSQFCRASDVFFLVLELADD